MTTITQVPRPLQQGIFVILVACALFVGVFAVVAAYTCFWAESAPGPTGTDHRTAMYWQGFRLLVIGLGFLAVSATGLTRWIVSGRTALRTSDFLTAAVAAVLLTSLLHFMRG